MNAFSFCLFSEIKFSHTFSKDGFARHIDSWLRVFFFFITLYILAHCVLFYNFLLRNWLVIIENLLYVMNHFSLVLKIFFFAFVFWKFNYKVSSCGSLLSFWGLVSFLGYGHIHVFHQIWDIFSHYFFKYSLCPSLSFWDSHSELLIHLMVSHRSLKFCSCLFNLFSFVL